MPQSLSIRLQRNTGLIEITAPVIAAIIISYSYHSYYCNRHSYSYTTITIHIPIAILAAKAITFIAQSYRAAAHAPLLSPDAKYFPLESNATDVTMFV
jgi:hypothetical protein